MRSRLPRSRLVTMIAPAALSATIAGVALAQEGSGEQAQVEETSPVRYAAEADATLLFSSNVYHEQNRRLGDFDTQNHPGERYYEMQGPEDFIVRPNVELGLDNRVDKNSRPELSLYAEYSAYLANGIANYFLVQPKVEVDLTREDEIELSAEIVLPRFRKNYRIERGGVTTFEHAYYFEVTPLLAYEHEWSSGWSNAISYELDLRRYDEPFDARSFNRHTVGIGLGYEPNDALDLDLTLSGGITDSGTETQAGVLVDRSHDDVELALEGDLDLPHHWEVEAATSFRLRYYTTGETADDAHFDRVDPMFDVEAMVARSIAGHLRLHASIEWTIEVSDRVDPMVDPDDVGYQELVLAIGAGGYL